MTKWEKCMRIKELYGIEQKDIFRCNMMRGFAELCGREWEIVKSRRAQKVEESRK